MRISKTLTALVVVGLLTACEDTGPKQGAGTVIGGVGGALAGSAFGRGHGRLVGVAAGTLLGALLGSEIGKSLDKADRDSAALANQRALEYNRAGEPMTWRNPDSGNSGTVTPQRTYQTAEGQYCREYQQTITVGGQTQTAYGRACRQPDGSWKIVN
ncbi:MAG TPA: RT0821/Lpp0805 family surface protein [Candidatus Cybelea sp.]|nr:RT0821/Lpp0805 family surface protein [Candidatus Cybelea sp.]